MRRTQIEAFRKALATGAGDFEPDNPYWLYNDETGEEGEDTYCFDCLVELYGNEAGKMTTNLYNEHDSPLRCDHCGKLLKYVLTDYGASEELSQFAENGLDISSADQCYEMERALGAWLGMGYWRMSDIPKDERNKLARLITSVNAPFRTKTEHLHPLEIRG